MRKPRTSFPAPKKRQEDRLIKNKALFLDALAKCGRIDKSAKSIGVYRGTIYDWMRTDGPFANAVDEARTRSLHVLEDEVHRRAVDGVDKPIYQGGVRVGVVREYSDVLLLFLLKANNPKKYRDNTVNILKIDAGKRVDWDFGNAGNDSANPTKPGPSSPT